MRKGLFQFVVPLHQRIIVRIGNFRRILGMVEPVMLGNLARQTHQLIGGIGFGEL